jgi:hypothetical protein
MIVGVPHAAVMDTGVRVGGEPYGVTLFEAPKFPNAD